MPLSENTLFKRLRDGRAARDPSMSLDRPRLRQSIAANLELIFGSREMHAPAQLDYGMPDPNTILHADNNAVDMLRKRLKVLVEKYEPRLSEVRVLHIESAELGHQIQFSLQATLLSDPPEPISIDATINSLGRIRVTA